MIVAKKLVVYIGVPLVALILVAGTAIGLIFFYKNREATPVESRKKLVIDHDGGADDAFAITMSLLYEKYFKGPNVVGLTTTYGNVNLTQVIINSDRILTVADRQDVPIYRGAYRSLIRGIVSDYFFGYDGLGDNGYFAPAPIQLQDELAPIALLELSKKYEGELIVVAIGPLTNLALAVPIYRGAYRSLIRGIVSDYFFGYDGLGDNGYFAPAPIQLQDELAPIALLELSKKYEGELIVVAIGPLTNLALAVSMDSKFIGRLAHLYIGAGHIQSKEHPNSEFNAQMDPEAYYIVANNSNAHKVTFVPFSQVYDYLNITLDWRKNVLGKIETPIMEALNSFERISLPKEKHWTQLDPATMAIALDNDVVDEFKNSRNNIILEGSQRGINTNNFSAADPNIRVAYLANKEKYKKILLDIYSAELQTQS